MMTRPLLPIALLLTVAIAACERSGTTSDVADNEAPWRQPGDVIDSVFPMDEQLRRFRVDLTPVTALSEGAGSRDELVRRFVTAVEQRDTAEANRLFITRDEFGWLYFPHHDFAQKPYEMPPGLFWMNIQQNSQKGIGRLFERYGARDLNYQGYRCEAAETKPLGDGTVHAGCLVIYDKPSAGRDTMQFFSGIFELNGRFKFVSYSNAF